MFGDHCCLGHHLRERRPRGIKEKFIGRFTFEKSAEDRVNISQDRQTPGREGKIIFFSKKLVYFSGVKLRKFLIEKKNLGNGQNSLLTSRK